MQKTELWLLAKSRVERIPGAFALYKWVTSHVGEGRVYTISRGPLRGLQWRRFNRLPYWYHLGIYEPHVSQWLRDTLRPGDVFWDIGAHAGYHTLVGARAVGASGAVLAVEPDPDSCTILREQLSLNDVRNCTVVQAAIADRDGTRRFVRSTRDSRINALEGFDEGGESIDVECVSLDSLVAAHGSPNVVKIDIEGAEAIVLPAADRFLSAMLGPRAMLVSTHGSDADRITREVIAKHGYQMGSDAFPDEGTIVASRLASFAPGLTSRASPVSHASREVQSAKHGLGDRL